MTREISDGRFTIVDCDIDGVGRVEWAECVVRTDGETLSLASVVVRGPALVSAFSSVRPDKFAEQAHNVRKMAQTMTRLHGVHYEPRPEQPGPRKIGPALKNTDDVGTGDALRRGGTRYR